MALSKSLNILTGRTFTAKLNSKAQSVMIYYLPAAGRQIPKITHIEGAVTFHMNYSRKIFREFSQSEASKNMTYRR